MAKQDVVSAQLEKFQAAVQQAQSDAFSQMYDAAVADQPAPLPDGTPGVAQSVVDGLNQQISDLHTQLDQVNADDAAAKALVQKLHDGLDSLESNFVAAVQPAPADPNAPAAQ